MKRKKLPLAKSWDRRLKLWAEGNKLRAEGYKLWAEVNKLWTAGYARIAAGDKLWEDAVKDANENHTWIWRNDGYDCKLTNGDVYRHDQKGG